jgi:hypothetical protein
MLTTRLVEPDRILAAGPAAAEGIPRKLSALEHGAGCWPIPAREDR